MSRLLRLTAGESRLGIRLLPDRAPQHCLSLATFFSGQRRATALHVMYDGPAFMLPFEPDETLRAEIEALPLENATCYPAPGDAFWFRFPAYTLPGQSREIWEVAIAYDTGVRLFSQTGWTPASVFGSVPAEQIGSLAAFGRGLRTGGAASTIMELETE